MSSTYTYNVSVTVVLEDKDNVLASKLALRGLKALSEQFSRDGVIGGFRYEGVVIETNDAVEVTA